MEEPAIGPLRWPTSGRPQSHPSHPPLVAHIGVMLAGGGLCLAVNHPAPGFAAAIVCAVMFTFSARGLRVPVVAHIRRQLMARPECLRCWGSDPSRVQAAGMLCAATARVMNWPNDHFIPEDPLELAFFELSGVDQPIDIFEVLVEVTKKLGCEIRWSDFTALTDAPLVTLADLLSIALAQHPITSSPSRA